MGEWQRRTWGLGLWGLACRRRLVGKDLEWSMALHEVGGVEVHAELGRQLGHALRLRLSPAVGEQDEGDPVLLKVSERLGGAGEGFRGMQEHAIDTDEAVSHRANIGGG